MRVGLQHLDPKIAKMILARLCAPWEDFLLDNILWDTTSRPATPKKLFDSKAPVRPPRRKPNVTERTANALQRKREQIVRGQLLTAVIGVPLATFVTYFVLSTADVQYLPQSASFFVFAVTSYIGLTRVRKATAKYELQYDLTMEEWHAVLPLLQLDPVDSAYSDLVLSAAERDPNQEARRAIRRDLLLICDLMAEYRRLEKLVQAHQAVADTQEFDLEIQAVREEFRAALVSIREAHERILVAPSQEADAATRLILTSTERATRNVNALVSAAPSEVVRRGRIKERQV